MNEEINYSDMVKSLAKDGGQILDSMTAGSAHLLHMAIGIVGEVLELESALFNRDLDNALEELGDLEFYLEGFCQGLKIPAPMSVSSTAEHPREELLHSANVLLDHTKKAVIYQKDIPAIQYQSTLAYMRSCLSSIYGQCGFTVDQAMEYNIKKLSVRYENFKYSDQAAQVRADKAGGE